MEIEDLFTQSIDRVFEKLFAPPIVESFVRSGSYLLRLCFSNKLLADEILPSFLPVETGLADLDIGFLTSAEVDLSHLIPHPQTELRAVACDGWFAMWQPGDLPVLHLLDRKSKRAVIWLAAGGAPVGIASQPTLPIMYAFSVDTPWITLHAAAIGREDRILLLAGQGRAGKTTAALACARAGWDYAGDDYVYANTTNGQVESLYCSARLRADMAPAFSDLMNEATTGVSNSDGELRHELRLAARLGPGRVKGGSLAAILLPRRRGAALPIFSPARRFDAVSAFHTSMVFQLGWLDVGIKKITTVIGMAPVFFVDTGQNLDAIPNAFAEFLDGL